MYTTILKAQITIAMIFLISSLYAQFAGGSGTATDPWLIQSRAHLESLNEYTGSEHTDKYFKQIADIDLSGEPWDPIGRTTAFFGHYDGDGYSISNLTDSDFISGHAGLF